MTEGLPNFAAGTMAKKKLQHFAEMKEFGCVFQPDMEDVRSGKFALRGHWHRDYFKNDRPITVELGCGKGEYSIALARRYPGRNFIGVDIKGARLWKGAKTAHLESLENVAFLRTKVEFIDAVFAPGEVDEIWLTFSDPQPKDRKGTKRLTGVPFLNRYRRILSPGGKVHLKTDSTHLFCATLDTLESQGNTAEAVYEDIYGADRAELTPEEAECLEIKTFYEKKFLDAGKKITYIRFKLDERVEENIRT